MIMVGTLAETVAQLINGCAESSCWTLDVVVTSEHQKGGCLTWQGLAVQFSK